MKTSYIISKLNQLHRKTNCIENIYFCFDDTNYLSDTIFNIEIELSKQTKRFNNQFKYFNKKIKKYNKRHNTNYHISIYKI